MAIDIPREVALKVLYDINENGAYTNISLNKHLESYELRELDRAFITDLVYGTVKWRLKIDWIIQQFSSIKLKKISPWIINILRLGVYQLLYTSKIPESAACNESVNLSKKYGHASSRGFVNAILRNITKNRDKIKYPDKEKELCQYLSVWYSHPEWLVEEWLGNFGLKFTESLLEANNGIPDFTIRANTLRISREELIEDFKKVGIEALKGKHIDEAIVLKSPSSITRLEAFKKGYFQVQDESSMLVSKVLDPKPGDLVIDVCSAPGGKSTHMAQLMNNKGTVIARDIHQHKLKIINDTSKRLGFDIIKAEIFDATKTDEKYIGKADRVLVDAPCSGYGIIRRKPDLKWARDIKDKKEIVDLQFEILNAASKYLKPLGMLVYSTCTIEKEENEELVRAFLKLNSDFELVDISSFIPKDLKKKSINEGFIQLFPNVDDLDGFFMAKMIKRG